MKLLGWFDTAESDAFARDIAEEFVRAAPPPPHGLTAREYEQRLTHAIEVIGNRAAKYDAAERLGWYRKSRFMKAIENVLLARGHAADLANRVVYAIVVRTARRP